MLAFILSSVMTLVPVPGTAASDPAAAPAITAPAPQAPDRSAQPMEPRTGRPVIRAIDPDNAHRGTEVIITGRHLGGTTAVTFGKGHKAEFKVINGHKISATVPDDATSARVRVMTSHGGAVSQHRFVVTEGGEKTN